jgi:hypothetical protein
MFTPIKVMFLAVLTCTVLDILSVHLASLFIASLHYVVSLIMVFLFERISSEAFIPTIVSCKWLTVTCFLGSRDEICYLETEAFVIPMAAYERALVYINQYTQFAAANPELASDHKLLVQV